MTALTSAGPAAVVRRLIDALNRHDLDGMLDCFDPEVRTASPTQPERGVRGRDYLRAYWAEALIGAGDLQAEVKSCAVDCDTVLAEWCWHGNREDGSAFARAGVTVHRVDGDRIVWQRLYMEPVQGDPATVGAWVVQEMARRSRR
jgi:ketosteroid isomerase-like protein